MQRIKVSDFSFKWSIKHFYGENVSVNENYKKKKKKEIKRTSVRVSKPLTVEFTQLLRMEDLSRSRVAETLARRVGVLQRGR